MRYYVLTSLPKQIQTSDAIVLAGDCMPAS